MPTGLFLTRSLKFLCLALILALVRCNPEKQWQLDMAGHLPDLCVTVSFAEHAAMTTPRAKSPEALYYPSYSE